MLVRPYEIQNCTFSDCLRRYDVRRGLLDDDCDDIHHQRADRVGNRTFDHHLESIGTFPSSFRVMCCQRC